MSIGKLEPIAIKKRAVDNLKNTTTEFGPNEDTTKGYTMENEYDTEGTKAQKGTESGYLSDHLNSTKFDITKGGSKTDAEARLRQQSYQIPDVRNYDSENIYSDADDLKVDTSGNIGQVIIF